MISSGTIASLIGEIIFIFTVPLLIAILLKIKIKAKFFPFFAGMMSCLFFIVEAENLILSLVLGASPNVMTLISENFFVYLLVQIINTLLFEIGGMWLVFRFLLKDYEEKSAAVNFGIGYGMLGAIVSYGISAFISLSYCLVYNDLGEAALIESMSDIADANVDAIISGIKSINSVICIATTADQMIEIGVITALTFMVFFGIRRRAPFYIKFACALCAVYKTGKTITEFGLIKSIFPALLIDLVLGGIIMYGAYKMYKAYDYDEVDFRKIFT